MAEFYSDLNINKNKLKDAVIEPRSTAPSNPKQGQIYYDTTDDNIYRYDGTNWLTYQDELETENGTAVSIDGIPTKDSSNLVTSGGVYNALQNSKIYYGECSTAAATQAKTVTITDFPTTLTAGLSVRIKFVNGQTYAGTPTLQVNSTGAKSIYRSSTAGGQYMWYTGEVLDFVYDGTNWVAINETVASTTYYGVTKLSSSTSSTSTSLAATSSAVKAAYDLANEKQSPLTASASGPIATFERITGGMPVNSLEIAITPVQTGTGDPSPSNVRSISGWTGAEITRTGKNLCPPFTIGYYYDLNTGELITNNTSACTPHFRADFSSGSVTFSFNVSLRGSAYAWDESGNFIGRTTGGPATPRTIVPTDFSSGSGTQEYSKIAFIALRLYVGTESTDTIDAVSTAHTQLEAGSIATTYEPYTGETKTIDWQSQAGTVYGGTLNVTTGILTVNKIGLVFTGAADESWTNASSSGDNFFVRYIYSGKPVGTIANRACSHFVNASVVTGNTTVGYYAYTSSLDMNSVYLNFRPDSSVWNGGTKSVANWKTWLAGQNTNGTPVTCYFEIAEPFTYQLTSVEVTTLLSENNIWVNTGNIIEVTFGEDIKAYVDDKATDKQDKITASGILKGNGLGGVSSAEAGVDYVTPVQMMALAGPLVANTAAEMTDIARVYVYVGSEAGYTNGNWYYYNGSTWVSGGVYNAVAVQTDTTLSVAGAAADAKAVGDAVIIEQKSRAGRTILIDDAFPGVSPINVPVGAIVYGVNMYQINAEDRTSGSVEFTVSSTDPNTVIVDGTATSNGYSWTSITKENAKMLLQPGAYFFEMFTTNDNINFYINVLSDESSTTSAVAVGKADSHLYTLVLTERSYVAVRVQVPSGVTCDEDTVSIYASKVPSDGNYYKYVAPNGLMRDKTVVVCQNNTDYIRYYARLHHEWFPVDLDIATFNCGDYSGGSGGANIPTGDLNEYAKYIASLDADILFTQEDREYWNITDQITTKSVLYNYLYANGGVYSRSTSQGGVSAKGIYSNLNLINKGRYTFATQGTTTDGGTSYYWNSFSYYFLELPGGKEILLISVHLAPKQWNTNARKAQIAEILDFINACGTEYVVIAGDMNTWSDEMSLFSSYVLANQGLFGEMDTFYGSNDYPFDNIIVTPNIKIRNVKVHTDNTFQDHFALSATITIN